MDGLLERRLTGVIIAAFYCVYDELGFGFLESVYVSALLLELTARGIQAQREARIDVYYRGVEVGHITRAWPSSTFRSESVISAVDLHEQGSLEDAAARACR